MLADISWNRNKRPMTLERMEEFLAGDGGDALLRFRNGFASHNAISRYRSHDSNFFACDVETSQNHLLRQPLLNVFPHLLLFATAFGAQGLAHDEKFAPGPQHAPYFFQVAQLSGPCLHGVDRKYFIEASVRIRQIRNRSLANENPSISHVERIAFARATHHRRV